MAAIKTLKIIFKMDDDSKHTVSLKDPKTGLTRAEVNNWGNLVIAKEAITTGNDVLPVSVSDAYIDISDREELAG